MLLLRVLVVLVLALILGGCESASVKYPSPAAVYYLKSKPTPSNHRIVKRGKSESHRKSQITFLNCRSFVKKRQGLFSLDDKICLSYCYIKYSELKRARVLLSNLEKEHLTSKEYARVYALLGVIRVKIHKSGKDYFELSYAYDSSNRLARYMLSTRHPSLEFALQFAERWCRGGK